MAKIHIIGTAYPFRGGLAAYNERLARAFQQLGHEVAIETFTVQYPAFLFPGKTQYAEGAAPADLKMVRCIHSMNPFNWVRVGLMLSRMQPDVVVVKYWIPFMAPCFGTILRLIRRNKHTRIICILDNVIPHEHHLLDGMLTRYFLKPVDAFIAMSQQVLDDLRRFTDKPAVLVPHPIYDVYGQAVDKNTACARLELDPKKRYALFFGLIRAYKGLDLLLRAFADPSVRELQDVHLIVAGEFYESPEPYLQLIEQLHLQDRVILHDHFIPDEEVKYYFSAADVIIQPYKSATQSGITQIAYHFEKPMIVTRVGGLPEMVMHQRTGLICEPEPEDIARAIVEFFQTNSTNFIHFIQEAKKRFSWEYLCEQILELAHQTSLATLIQ
ncbi:glycosyltransferase [Thermoflavifilum thermophilum]|uniref:Glycosyltransferase involved in cell wall bisynthesis n=1 Tax=Thermoflavifilum thermophilum TaxID=1393122 RepID=A0A1I7NL42_9BACT|nr:glycosyltransferase [Thermoflavifilum thermophilum]SFV35336.1 Glycosyltransferase involved in cell wall bisynthesis [Thermoflavifilum thermophilum]